LGFWERGERKTERKGGCGKKKVEEKRSREKGRVSEVDSKKVSPCESKGLEGKAKDTNGAAKNLQRGKTLL